MADAILSDSPSLTQARLKELLHYNRETGIFTWIKPTSRRVSVGSICKVNSKLGYVSIRIDGVLYWAHRLAWLYETGAMPKEQIDHANGVKDDNRWSNLRVATKSQNMRNAGRRRNNTSGYTGVGLHNQTGKWRAYIARHGRTIHLGLFDTKEEALAARELAAKKAYGEFHLPQPQ